MKIKIDIRENDLITILQSILTETNNHVLIKEQLPIGDIIIYDNFFERYNELINNVPKDWDIISIFVDQNQYDRFDESQKINYYVSKGYQDWSTLGYVISKPGAKKI